eukprot:TRINITY_DN11526_c0_g1_i1.p1 TRINITY_DN11526_c0_g1~~TRINITY_DN11526_c0_g1_i1.p1  ORF type:complete len:850 (-),score=168.25 TRINITY_DN11526_c0_g1_i1:64-2613(-)
MYVLNVRPINALNLQPADVTGYSDPYCSFKIAGQIQTSSTKTQTLNPEWDENENCLFLINDSDRVLHLTVYDHDEYSPDDPIGSSDIQLGDIDGGYTDVEKEVVLDNVDSGVVHLMISVRSKEEDETIEAKLYQEQGRIVRREGVQYRQLNGTVYEPIDFIYDKSHKLPPKKRLTIDHVYGYRGVDCRDNLYYLPDGRVVYFTAILGIVHNPETNEQEYFMGHNDDIKSLAVHPSGNHVATGQVPTTKGSKLPKICIWDVNNIKRKIVIEGDHTSAITALGFSGNGKLVSVGEDSENTIVLYDWKNKVKLCHLSGGRSRILVTSFCPYDKNLILTAGVKNIRLWNYSNGRLTSVRGLSFGKVPVQTILSVIWHNGNIITGTLKGYIIVWNLERKCIVKVLKYHRSPVYTLLEIENGFISGDGKGKIAFWESIGNGKYKPIKKVYIYKPIRKIDIQKNCMIVGTKSNEIWQFPDIFSVEEGTVIDLLPIVKGHSSETWALCTIPDTDIFVTGDFDGELVAWNKEIKQSINNCKLDSEIYCIGSHPQGELIAVGLGNGIVNIIDPFSLEILIHLEDPHNNDFRVTDIKYSPCGSFLAVSRKMVIDVYHAMDSYKYLGKCEGHSGIVTHFDWSFDGKAIQSDSNAHEHLYWDIEDLEQIKNYSRLASLKWNSWTCLHGWHVKGIWPHNADGHDINALNTSIDGKLLVTGDCDNMVKLFRFPTYTDEAKNRCYKGHAAFVTNIRFCGPSHVLSMGGTDSTIIQWRVTSSELKTPVKKQLNAVVTTPTKNGYSVGLRQLNIMLENDVIQQEEKTAIEEILKDTRKERINATLLKLQTGRLDQSDAITEIREILS